MNKKWFVGAAVAVVLSLITAWALGMFQGDPQMAELEQLRDEVLSGPQPDRGKVKEQFAAKMKGMSDEQKKEFFKASMPMFVKMGAMHMEKRFDDFLALSPEDQRRQLDEKIDEELTRKKQNAGERQGPQRPPVSPDQANEFMKKMHDWTTPQQRAKFQAVMGMYNARRVERGLEEVSFGRKL